MPTRGHTADGEKLKEWRTALGWTQDQLAAKANCNPRTVRNAERGQPVDLKTLTAIAAALGKEVRQVLLRDESTEQANVRLVEDWLQAWMDGDVEQLLPFHHPETVLELPGAGKMPNIPESETFTGLIELRDHLTYVFSEFTWVREKPGRQIDAVGDLVFHRTEAVFRGNATGREATTRFFNEFEVAEGLIVRRLSISELSGHEHVLGLD